MTKTKTTLLLVTLLLFSFLVVYIVPRPVYAQSCTTFPDCWGYRKKITIQNNVDQDLTDYQINITVHYGSGTDSNYDIYLNSHSQTDFDDIRFALSDGTLLSYWREEYTDSDYAIFWFKVPSISASGAVEIYVYYDNPDATYDGDPEQVFDFYDDFEDGVIDSSKWSVVGSGVSESDGKLNLIHHFLLYINFTHIQKNIFSRH